MAVPPLGLLAIAAMLPSDWQLRLVDTNVERLKDDDLRWADYVKSKELPRSHSASAGTLLIA